MSTISDDVSTPIKMEVSDTKEEKPNSNEEPGGFFIEVPTDEQCYCGKQRDFNEPDFQCSACNKWFHIKCITFNVGNALPFMTTYHFMCKMCNQMQEEVFSKKQANFAVMCQTALANLTFAHQDRSFFSTENDVIPFLEEHWEALTTQPRKTNKSWHANINKTLTVTTELFKTKEEGGSLLVTLANKDLSKIGPSYDRFRYLASQLKTDITKLGIAPGGAGPGSGGVGTGGGSGAGNSRKRKAAGLGMTGGSGGAGGTGGGVMGGVFAGQGGVSSGAFLGSGSGSAGSGGLGELATSGLGPCGIGMPKSRRGGGGGQAEEGKAKLNANGFPVEHPFNKDGYRYILVEPDPHAPYRQKWDECEHTAGKPIPGFFYRLFHSPKVLLSMNDRAHQLKLTDTQTSVTGEKGYSMTRATHHVNRGNWYYEVTITDQPEGSHTRIGWSQILGAIQAPCGYDKFSYSWRSRKGTAFHASKGHHFADTGYTKDDVIGCMIRLPDPANKLSAGSTSIVSHLPETFKERPLIKFKNSFYFEEKDEVQKTEKSLKPQAETQILFYKNGVSQGVAFSNIYAGNYYPAISLYKSVTALINFGPEFKHAPQDMMDWKPMSDRVSDLEVEQTLADVLHLVDKSESIARMLS